MNHRIARKRSFDGRGHRFGSHDTLYSGCFHIDVGTIGYCDIRGNFFGAFCENTLGNHHTANSCFAVCCEGISSTHCTDAKNRSCGDDRAHKKQPSYTNDIANAVADAHKLSDHHNPHMYWADVRGGNVFALFSKHPIHSDVKYVDGRENERANP